MRFDAFCKSLECPHYNEWDYTLNISDHGRDYESTIECASCNKNPESECVDQYPIDCVYLEALVDYEIRTKLAHAKFEKEWEQKKIWKKLTHV